MRPQTAPAPSGPLGPSAQVHSKSCPVKRHCLPRWPPSPLAHHFLLSVGLMPHAGGRDEVLPGLLMRGGTSPSAACPRLLSPHRDARPRHWPGPPPPGPPLPTRVLRTPLARLHPHRAFLLSLEPIFSVEIALWLHIWKGNSRGMCWAGAGWSPDTPTPSLSPKVWERLWAGRSP